MASSMPPRGLRVGGSLRRRAFSVTTCDRGFASGISCFLLLPGSGAGRSHHPVYRWRSERLRQQAFRVRGSAPFGLVSQVAAYVAQVPHVPFGGACLPDVLNLQISVALQMSSLDGFDLCYPDFLIAPAGLRIHPDPRPFLARRIPIGRPPSCNHSPSPGCSSFPPW